MLHTWPNHPTLRWLQRRYTWRQQHAVWILAPSRNVLLRRFSHTPVEWMSRRYSMILYIYSHRSIIHYNQFIYIAVGLGMLLLEKAFSPTLRSYFRSRTWLLEPNDRLQKYKLGWSLLSACENRTSTLFFVKMIFAGAPYMVRLWKWMWNINRPG